ncbi:MAG: GH25 family lysozyme [Acidiferrobacterales bacterium]
MRQTREGQREHALDNRAIFPIGVRFLIFGWLAVTSANVASADPNSSANPVFAIDISFWSGNISATEVSCWRGRGVQHVVTGAQVRDITRQQLQMAIDGGMTVDAYVLLYWDFDITQQVQTAFSIIEGFPVRRLWLDAEQPRGNWSAPQLIQKIQEGVNACGNMSCGIYTRKVWWRDNVDNTSAFSHLPIWYAYYDGRHGFNDWYSPSFWYEGPFGGWSDPTSKQYDSDWTAPDLCGVNVDYNIMYVRSDDPPSPPSVPPAPTGLAPDGATIATGAVTLSANAIANATRYEFKIEYWDEATWQHYYTYTPTSNAQTFWPVYHTAYQWRLRAENQFGWSAWSDWATFNFGNLPPPAPTGLTPNGTTITTSAVTLSANAIANTTGYEFEIGYWDGGAWRYYYTYAPANNTQTFWPVYANRQYRWRVRAQNQEGWGAWSTWATFNFFP